VGAEAIWHVVHDDPAVAEARNPLPAAGGQDPETVQQVRQRAPVAFRTQERAVTESDYADKVQLHGDIQRAAATFRWTGSWHTVFVTADRKAGRAVDAEFERDLRDHLERYRMAGYDLEVDGPRLVSLEIEAQVCVKSDYFRADVRNALLEVLGASLLPDGRLGLFHPDNFSFGQPVYLSRLYARAQEVPGVSSVHVTVFQRQGKPETSALASGRLDLDRLEIARCDNDPNFPEHGELRIVIGGGK
jgi:predicted phage baseplate assembly protein